MKSNEEMSLDVLPVHSIEASIDRWLATRDNFTMQSTDEARHEYNATLYDL